MCAVNIHEDGSFYLSWCVNARDLISKSCGHRHKATIPAVAAACACGSSCCSQRQGLALRAFKSMSEDSNIHNNANLSSSSFQLARQHGAVRAFNSPKHDQTARSLIYSGCALVHAFSDWAVAKLMLCSGLNVNILGETTGLYEHFGSRFYGPISQHVDPAPVELGRYCLHNIHVRFWLGDRGQRDCDARALNHEMPDPRPRNGMQRAGDVATCSLM